MICRRVRLSCTVLGNKTDLLKKKYWFIQAISLFKQLFPHSASILLSHVLPLEENAEALIHWGLILSSIHLAFLKGLDGAELASQPLEQSFTYMQGFKHPLIHWSQLPVDLNLGMNKKWPPQKLQAKRYPVYQILYPQNFIEGERAMRCDGHRHLRGMTWFYKTSRVKKLTSLSSWPCSISVVHHQKKKKSILQFWKGPDDFLLTN